jgi:hypothetical protein
MILNISAAVIENLSCFSVEKRGNFSLLRSKLNMEKRNFSQVRSKLNMEKRNFSQVRSKLNMEKNL